MVICNRCFQTPAPPSHHHHHRPPAPSVKLSHVFHMCFDRNNGQNTFQHHSKHVMSKSGWTLGGHSDCGAMHKGSHTDAALSWSVVGWKEGPRRGLRAHTGRKNTWIWDAMQELKEGWRRLELERVQSMIAIFTRSLRWKSHCFWFTKKKGGGKHMEYPCWCTTTIFWRLNPFFLF